RRCRVPGCCNATFVDVHHITPRAEGGSNESHNLIVLCGAHHRAVHRGELLIDGATAANVRFRHSDGSRYGEAASATQIDVQTKVFQILCKLEQNGARPTSEMRGSHAWDSR
ncbi:MAG: HNH endonuclease signature motif containing protein, partial [Polyangiaceae bacterium]